LPLSDEAHILAAVTDASSISHILQTRETHLACAQWRWPLANVITRHYAGRVSGSYETN